LVSRLLGPTLDKATLRLLLVLLVVYGLAATAASLAR
jgi:hypothetical protein